jgi:hypothetical protein
MGFSWRRSLAMVFFRIPAKTIYGWMRASVDATGAGTNLIPENNRLKKELEQAYALLGRAQAIMNRSKN